MKSYLSLIPISSKVNRRQNTMTILCIVFAVFLVTSIFSMVEMGIRMEQTRLLEKHGSLDYFDLINSSMGQSLLIIAGILCGLVLIAGVLMISSSINNNVAQRTKFFGMMRCIGMNRRQITRFVRLEALNWCKLAIPIGLSLGVLTTWILSAALKFFVGGEFSDMPLFGISIMGIICGIVIGILTVLIAASSPAKRASKVSPITAVSGNSEPNSSLPHRFSIDLGTIETQLGIHHAISAKKNLILMASSFALSIILFLCFSVLIDFVGYLMPQSASTSDINISTYDGTNSIDKGLIERLKYIDGVKNVYGRRSYFDIPTKSLDGSHIQNVDIISYDDFDLNSLMLDDMLVKGSDISKVYGDSHYVLATPNENNVKIGSVIVFGDEVLEIAGLLKFNPFSSDGEVDGVTIISSSENFSKLTDVNDYSLVMVQTESNVTEEDMLNIEKEVGENYIFTDRRDQRTTGTYIAFIFCVYAFLIIITSVTVLNIINSVSMSVNARIKEYGAMRAIGMSPKQMRKMISAEALTYAVSGCILGCVIGFPLSRTIYESLITSHFSYAVWTFPFKSTFIILLFVSIATTIAIYKPTKQIMTMKVTDVINQI